MNKFRLRGKQMSDAAMHVDRAATWAKTLTQAESRGPGDLENAWRRLEARYGVSANTFWSLRYRRPKDIAASIYFSLQAAYFAECERQERRFSHERAIARQIAGSDHVAVRKAEALVEDAPRAPRLPQSVSRSGSQDS